MNTSSFSSHTPVTEVIKWTWLDIFHLTDVFDVVLVSHPLPPPTQLRWYLKQLRLQQILRPSTQLFLIWRKLAINREFKVTMRCSASIHFHFFFLIGSPCSRSDRDSYCATCVPASGSSNITIVRGMAVIP